MHLVVTRRQNMNRQHGGQEGRGSQESPGRYQNGYRNRDDREMRGRGDERGGGWDEENRFGDAEQSRERAPTTVASTEMMLIATAVRAGRMRVSPGLDRSQAVRVDGLSPEVIAAADSVGARSSVAASTVVRSRTGAVAGAVRASAATAIRSRAVTARVLPVRVVPTRVSAAAGTTVETVAFASGNLGGGRPGEWEQQSGGFGGGQRSSSQGWTGQSYGQTFGQGYAGGGYGRQSEGPGYGQQSSRGRGFSGRGPKGYQRSDERLKEQISDRLMDDDDIDASEITVEVANGEVTLTGTVSSRQEKRAAEDAVEQIPGVREVQNHLRIKSSNDASASQSNQSWQSGNASQSLDGGSASKQTGSDSGRGDSQSKSQGSSSTSMKSKNAERE